MKRSGPRRPPPRTNISGSRPPGEGAEGCAGVGARGHAPQHERCAVGPPEAEGEGPQGLQEEHPRRAADAERAWESEGRRGSLTPER